MVLASGTTAGGIVRNEKKSSGLAVQTPWLELHKVMNPVHHITFPAFGRNRHFASRAGEKSSPESTPYIHSRSSTLSTRRTPRRRFLKRDPTRRRLRPSRLLSLFLIRRSPRRRFRSGFRARSPTRRRSGPSRHHTRSARDRARAGVGERSAAAGAFLAGVGELLGEGGLFAHDGAFPVDDVDGEDEEAGDADCRLLVGDGFG